MQFNLELLKNVILVAFTYLYILSMILLSDNVQKAFRWSGKTARKTLHVMIGNLPFILPFFTHRIFPLVVAFTFIPLTFLASPYSPFQQLKNKISILQDKTEIGHPLGLVFYSFSYTVLTALFFHIPYIVVVGVLSMAYGDSTGAIIGERYGKRKYKIFTWKSVEGSLAIFGFTFISVTLGLGYYSIFYPFLRVGILTYAFSVAITATIIEAFSPKGTDNLFVPFACAILMYVIGPR